ncbi:MAG: hypothetical protein IJ654_07135 [Bacteroidales bacterium]|nr:hypothetical protein [Bacteroidales bacterium]
MKRYCVLCLLLFLSAGLHASGRGDWYGHWDYGIEWGYTASFAEIYHYNYTLPSLGARIDSRDSRLSYKSNGLLTAYTGVKFARHYALDALAGWAGVYEGRRMFPVTMRGSYFFDAYDKDGWKTFLEGGCCLGKSFAGKAVGIVKAGTGYRLMLDRYFALDLSLSLQGILDHPVNIYDRSREEFVPDGNLRRSDCGYIGINFTLALDF